MKNTLFGFDAKLLTMKEIVLVLEDQVDFIPSQQLANLCGYSSTSQILKLCKELDGYIKECYPSQEFELIINKHYGIKLVTPPFSNNDQLLDYIVMKDLAYLIYQAVLLERVVPTEEFCQDNFISNSTLQRRIKKINYYINNYGLHITFSQQYFKLSGDELIIRSFSFVLLFIIHRQLSKIPWIENKQNYLGLSQQIADYLSLPFLTIQHEVFGLLLFTFENARKKEFTFLYQAKDFPYMEKIHFPKKPTFLSQWTDDDWQFLLLQSYSTNLVNFEFPLDLSDVQSNIVNQVTQDWQQAFEESFLPLNDNQKSFLYDSIEKKFFSDYFFIADDALTAISFPVNLEQFKEQNPIYMHPFNQFWKTFSKAQPDWMDGYFKIQSLLLCRYFLPIRMVLPKVKVYVDSDLTSLSLNRMKDHLVLYFANKYQISIVTTNKEADLIVTTTKPQKDKILPGQEVVMTRIQLAKRDLLHIDQAIQKIVFK
ncbi:helix-turn-helix domain-containing protein [Enterococcus nangangensis]